MCGIDDMDSLDFAFIAGLVEMQLEGCQEGQQQQKEPVDEDPFDLDDASSDEQEEELSDEDEW
jgi:hypothetical protein